METIRGARLFLLTIAIALAAFLVSLDGFIVNVAIPTISGELGEREDIGYWVVTVFSMSSTLFVPLSGWLAARFGSVRLFVITTLLFSCFSILCGATDSFNQLLFFRSLQGATAGIITPLSLALIIASFPEEKRSVAIGFWSFFVMVGPAMGPMVGGWFADYYWSWMFYINLPFALFSAVTVWAILGGRLEKPWAHPLDYVGMTLLFIGGISIQTALNRGNVDDWFRSPLIVTFLILSLVSFAFFIVWEIFHPQPFIDLRHFKKRNFALGVLAIGCAMALLFSSFILDSLWVQEVLGYTPAWAGYTLTPVGLFPLLFYPLMGRFVSKLDLRIWIALSFILYSCTFFWLSRINPEVTFWDIAIPRLIQGIGFAFFTVPNSMFAIEGVSSQEMPFVISYFSFFRMMIVGFAVPLFVNMWLHWSTFYQERLAERTFITNPAFDALVAPFKELYLTNEQSLAVANDVLQAQASTFGLADIYYLFGWLFLGLTCITIFYKMPKRAHA